MTDLIDQIRDFLLSDSELSQKMERVQLTDGQVLFKQGDRNTAFYVIKSGQIRIYQGDLSKAEALRDRDSQEIYLDTLGAGQTLGELT